MSNDPPPQTPISKYSSNYPEPEAEYQEIIQNPDNFLRKLLSFHAFYGNNFRVPTLGGKQLDIHRLFLEVTSRGGIEKVVKDRRWKEVTAAFKFPSTLTSVSFVLRKYYLSLLFHFEQVYYFRKGEPNISSPATWCVDGSESRHAPDDGIASERHRVVPNPDDTTLVTGTIDGKLDFGYTVTVNYRGESLKGVLYHAPEAPNASTTSLTALVEPVHHRMRRKHQITFRDPAHPKRNRSGYTFFFSEQYHRLRPMYHGQERAISKKIGQLWSRMTEAEKQVYQDKGQRDKERYKAEMSEYKTSQHAPAS